MKKEHVDVANKVIFIADSKTPTGVAEVPLTDIAVEAFRNQIEVAGPGDWLFPSASNRTGHQTEFKKPGKRLSGRRCPLLPALRSPLHVRHTVKCRRSRRRVGDAAPSSDGRQGVQEVFADETSNEARGAGQAQPQG